MKVGKGLTTKQFIKEIVNGGFSTIEIKINNISQLKLYLIHKWDLFTDRQPVKEMFVNEIEKPNKDDECYSGNVEAFDSDFELWQKAEKKVMFQGWQKTGIDAYYECGNYRLMFHDGAGMSFGALNRLSELVNSLEDIFRYTNGELKLKGVEI